MTSYYHKFFGPLLPATLSATQLAKCALNAEERRQQKKKNVPHDCSSTYFYRKFCIFTILFFHVSEDWCELCENYYTIIIEHNKSSKHKAKKAKAKANKQAST